MMFFTLFLKECKTVCKSIIYIIFIAVTVLFNVTQFGDNAGSRIEQYYTQEEKVDGTWVLNPLSSNPLIKPQEGLEDYGYKYAPNPKRVIPETIVALLSEWNSNSYRTYPIGFYKNVKLNDKKQAEIEQIIIDITGAKITEMFDAIVAKRVESMDANGMYNSDIDYSEIIPVQVTYEEFEEKMARVDKLLGGGSSYSKSKLSQYGNDRIPLTYEEKLAEYNAFINDDKITGAFARLFCDYMGIIAGMFSVFAPVAFLMRDKRAKVRELVYSRDISSTKLVLARYTALVFMMILPFLVMGLLPTIQLTEFAIKNNLPVDVFGFGKYIIGWILPTLMTTTAVAFVITTLTNTPLAIVVQFLWSFLNLSMGALTAYVNTSGTNLINYGMNLIIRHNSIENLKFYKDNFAQLAVNRISYTILALALVILTIFIYEHKRRGEIDGRGSLRKIFKNRKNAA